MERSVIYNLNNFGENLSLIPVELPNKKIISFSGSLTHFIAVTSGNLFNSENNLQKCILI